MSTHNVLLLSDSAHLSHLHSNHSIILNVLLCALVLTLTVLVTAIDALRHFETDNDRTVRGDGGSRVGEVRAGTTSPMPEHKGFKLQ